MSVFNVRAGDKVTGKYVGKTLVTGTVSDFRMRNYEMIFYVDLDAPIVIYGRTRQSVVLTEKELLI